MANVNDRVTFSAADVEAWIGARVAKGAVRLVLMAEDRQGGSRVPRIAVMTWEVGESFDARVVARYVQALADAIVVLGDPREHFDLWSYRRGRSKPSARVTLYGQPPPRPCASCALKEAHIAKLGEFLRSAHKIVDEAHARNDRLDALVRKQHDELRAADAQRTSPWAVRRTRLPEPN